MLRFTSFKKPVGIGDKDFVITKMYAAIAKNERRNILIIAGVIEALKKADFCEAVEGWKDKHETGKHLLALRRRY